MEDPHPYKPFWDPSYAKPIAYTCLLALAVFVGLTVAVKSIALPADTKLQRDWQVSGKYVDDSSRRAWNSKIGGAYVLCSASAFGSKGSCDPAYKGKEVVAEMVSMPSFFGDVLVVAEIREGYRTIYSLSDAELLKRWEEHSSFLTMITAFAVIGVAGGFFSALADPKAPPKAPGSGKAGASTS
jgi:hypothetical protein